MIRILLSLLLLSVIDLPLIAADKKFTRITVDDGLSQSWVRSMQQDEYGFLWIGTKDGLNKYDGSRFTIYRPDSENNRGLENASVNQIYIDRNKKVWVCTLSGVYRYRRSRDYFEILEPFGRNFARCMVQSSDGVYWIGTNNGLVRYNPDDQSITRYSHKPGDPSSLGNDIVCSIFEDDRKVLWVGTEVGLNLFLPETQSFLHPTDQAGADRIAMNQVQHIIEDASQNIWIATTKGLYRFTRKSDNPSDGTLEKVMSASCRTMLIDTKNNLWIGHGAGQGLHVWPLDEIKAGGQLPEHYRNIGHNLRSLSDNSVEAMLMDRRGDIWIGTYGNGLNYFSYNSKPFHTVNFMEQDPLLHVSNRINTFCFDDPYLWIGTETSLVRYDNQTGEYREYHHDPKDPTSIGGDSIYAIHKDRRGNLWVGAWNNGLNIYHPETDSFEHFKSDPRDAQSLSSNHIFCIFEDAAGRLWIGTIGGGLNEFDYENRTFVRYPYDPSKPEGIFSPYINDIAQTPDGMLWISTVWSVDRLNPETGEFTHFSHTGGPIDQNRGDLEVVYVDTRGQLWLGTEIGLVQFDPGKNTYQRFTVEDGLPNNAIKAICEDGEGNLWLTTNRGLSKFAKGIFLPKNPRFLNYDKNDGLQSNEFVKRAGAVSPDGLIYIGGTSGYTSFDPNEIRPNLISPKVLITDLYVGDHKVFPEKNSPILNTELYLADSIVLSYKDDLFDFRFTALDFPRTDNIRYSYILDGFDKEWRFTNGGHRVSYTNINPGDYVFRVKSTNDDGRWGENTASIRVRILPPWWGALWFRIVTVVVLLFLPFCFYFFRIRYLKRAKTLLRKRVEMRTQELSEANRSLAETQEELSTQNEELIRHRHNLELLVQERTKELQKALEKAEESDRLKSAFISNISHEIRTPLNGIMGFSQLIAMEAKEDGVYRDYVARIGENSQRLTQLLNDIIDFSILETGELTFNKTRVDAHELFKHLNQEFRGIVSVRGMKKVGYLSENHIPEDLKVEFETDQTRLKQILLNLISNSCKFTSEGYIKFGMKMNDEESEIMLSVEDTGIGIKAEEQEAIFERFYKIVDHAKTYIPGTGLGLSICRKLVDLLGYRLELQSAPGQGSTFTICIPVGRSSKLEKDDSPITVAEKRAGIPNWRGKTILVAEDAENNYIILQSFLNKTGINLVLARDGEEAIRLFQEMRTPPDLLLLDIKMPGLTGEEVLKRIRETLPTIPAIAQTAYALSSKIDEIMASGFQYCITKPINRDELIREISRLID